MPIVKPFNGVRYNPARIKSFKDVVCPPYDIISKKMQDALYKSHPNNIVRIEFGKILKSDTKKNNRYTRAALFLNDWLKKNILIRENRKAFYVYSQVYKVGSRTKEEIGFIGRMGLDMEKGDKVLPHENTLLAPKLDRLALVREVRSNISPIFALYEDASHKIARLLKRSRDAKKAVVDINSGGVRHRVWALDDPREIKVIEEFMRGRDIFIADGHHRYEVSRMYAEEVARDRSASLELKKNSRALMVYFVELDEGMLTVLPAHRLIRNIKGLGKEEIIGRLGKFFRIEEAKNLKAMMGRLDTLNKGCAFGVYIDKNFYILKLKDPKIPDSVMKDKARDWKRLDVSVLHLFVIKHVLGLSDSDENVEFVKEPGEVPGIIDSGRCKLAFFMNPTRVSQVRRIAKIGERMPRKSTYFYPKQLTGLVINKFI